VYTTILNISVEQCIPYKERNAVEANVINWKTALEHSLGNLVYNSILIIHANRFHTL